MPIYDPDQRKIVLRIVYDGPARAGKTTNVEQLSSYFTHRRRSDVIVPGAINGRTLYFDWMQLEGGLVSGHALRCQFVTVPGQRRLSARRREILRTADAVVFVCSSGRRSLPKARATLETLRWALRSAGREHVPLVVQANKRDLRSAATIGELRSALELDGEVPVLEATARSGTGVRETSVVAIRCAAREVERLLMEDGFDALRGHAEGPDELLRRVRDALPEPGAGLAAELAREDAEDEDEWDTPSHTAGTEAPETTHKPPQEEVAGLGPAPSADVLREPPRPREDVPTGCVWPSSSGRGILRRLEGERWQRLPELVRQTGTHDGSGDAGAMVYRVGGFCAKTSTRRRFACADEGRTALLNIARRKILLGHLLAPETVLSAQEDSEGAYWLWTVSPWTTTLRASMTACDGDDASLARVLDRFALAAAEALCLTVRQGLVLDLHPSNFGGDAAAPYYLDDDIELGSRLPSIGHALLQRAEEYADRAPVLDAYAEALSTRLVQALSPAELRALQVVTALEEVIPRSEGAARTRQTVLSVLSRHERGRA